MSCILERKKTNSTQIKTTFGGTIARKRRPNIHLVNCGGFEQRKLSYPGPGVIRYSSSTKKGFTPIKRQQRGFYPHRLKRMLVYDGEGIKLCMCESVQYTLQ
jgi:hypothetical protein